MQPRVRCGRLWRDDDDAVHHYRVRRLCRSAQPLRDGAEIARRQRARVRLDARLSRRDGWAARCSCHARRHGRDLDRRRGRESRLSLDFIASPDNATERYLFRARLDGRSAPSARRRHPDSAGTDPLHVPRIPGRFAFHEFVEHRRPGPSRARDAARPQGRSPRHRRRRRLKQKLRHAREATCRTLHRGAGDGLMVDGYMIKPAEFDPSKRIPGARVRIRRTGGTDRGG